MLGFRIKQAAARAAGSLASLDDVIRRQGDRYILCYHRVIPAEQARRDHVHDAMWVTPETFARQVAWMQSVGEIVDCREIVARSPQPGRPLFAITFDDGWIDNYQYAWPILKAASAPAMIFLATNALETGALFWPEDLVTKVHHRVNAGHGAAVDVALDGVCPDGRGMPAGKWAEKWVEDLKLLDEAARCEQIRIFYERIGVEQSPLPGYIMSWEQAREMAADGIAFGSHTHTHRILTVATVEQTEEELAKSKAVIGERLGTEADAFCYPNGRYTGSESEALRRHGFRYAYRLQNRSMKHCADPLYVPRLLVYEQLSTVPEYMKLRMLGVPYYA